MTQNEIIEMARQSGKHQWPLEPEFLTRFAKLVAQHEREACAQLADKYMERWTADAIRARGQA
jgi:hypothetical protein